MKAPLHSYESEEEDDVDAVETKIAKTEEQSDDSEGEDPEPTTFVGLPSTSTDNEQPGPSGVGKPADAPNDGEDSIDIKNHICPHCGKEFVNIHLLYDHLPTHDEVKLSYCKSCPKVFRGPHFLTHHRKKAHENPLKDFECDTCAEMLDGKVQPKLTAFEHPQKKIFIQVKKSLLAQPSGATKTKVVPLHWTHSPKGLPVQPKEDAQVKKKLLSRTIPRPGAEAPWPKFVSLNLNRSQKSVLVQAKEAAQAQRVKRFQAQVPKLIQIQMPKKEVQDQATQCVDLTESADDPTTGNVGTQARWEVVVKEEPGEDQAEVRGQANGNVQGGTVQGGSAQEISIQSEISEAAKLLLKCNICETTFTTLKALHYHTRREHEKDKYQVSCPICDKPLRRKFYLKRHMRLHTEQKLHKCDVCQRSYYDERALAYHKKKVHTESRPMFICEICGKTLTAKKSLEDHIRIHEGVRPYSCEICGKTFNKTAHVRIHLRKHTGEKPYKCDICGRGFTQSSTCIVHMRYHTGEKPYKCDICGATFVSNNLLKTHRRGKHALVW